MKVELKDSWIMFNTTFADNWKAKACGAQFQPSTKKWRVKPSRMAAAVILSNFPEKEVDPAILALAGDTVKIPEMGCSPQGMIKVVTMTDHQNRAVNKSWPVSGFAFFHVMGAGKTVSSIALANLRRAHSLIDQVLVVVPTSIKGVWAKEYERYSNMEQHVHILDAGKEVPTSFKGFPVLVVGVEGLSQGNTFPKAKEFVSRGRTMVIVDESSSIKNYKAGRTENSWSLGEDASFRLILTGTNVSQGIQDLFSQMFFVDPCIIGELSYFGFRNKYCVMGGYDQKKIVGYNNIEALFNKIRPYCDVVRKKDMKGLPEKNYRTREVKASPEQIRCCKELAKDMKTELAGKVITVQNALEAMLRFQQIAGGFTPDGDPLSSNPKMEELIAVLEEFDGKAIIWARYLPEVAAIATAIDKRWPGSVLTLWGAIESAARQPLVDEFQTNPEKRFFVVNQATGARGLTLTAATLAIYYSNTFSFEDRSQSEDRCHRMGQEYPVTYIDLSSTLKIDKMLLSALAYKKDVSEYVNDTLSQTRLSIDDLL